MEISTSDELHPIFKKDPEEWMKYVHKEVCVSTTQGAEHTGWVYTIDPVSETVVLVQFDNTGENQTKLEMIIGHAVQSIRVLNDDVEAHREELEKLFQTEGMLSLTPEELQKKRQLVKSWLLKNRMPVEVSGSNGEVLSISDALFIEPPYGPQNCRSTNEIILGRIQGLLKNMPSDVEDW